MTRHWSKFVNFYRYLLHILTINRVINFPTIIFGYSKLYCWSGARSRASGKSGQAKRSGERELPKNDGAEQEVAKLERSGEWGLQK